MTLADARARVPELVAFDHQPDADAAALAQLADWCDRYTPTVEVDAPDGLLLDIAGCGHAFGGDDGLADDLARRLATAGLTAHLAFGPTADAAAALARHPRVTSIVDLPVTALRVAPEIHAALARAGLKTVGALARRPRNPLAARFGMATVARLARLLGEADVRLSPRRIRPAIEAETRFAEPIGHSEDVLGRLASLAETVAKQLALVGEGGRRFDAALYRCDGAVARLSVATATPTRDAARIARLFHERVDSLNDPLDPGFGYDLLRLAVTETAPLAPEQVGLDGEAAPRARLDRLVDQLGVRLGSGRVRRFWPLDSHIPDRAATTRPAIAGPPPGGWDDPAGGEPPVRPLMLFDPPQPIDVIADVPDGPPRRFIWRRVQHEVTRAEGPERIAAEWWRHRSGRGVTRDYYRVEDRKGLRFWLFRHGLYGTEKPHPAWYIHGTFA